MFSIRYGPGPFQLSIACVSCVDAFEVGEVRVQHLRVAAVQRQPAPLAEARVTVQIAAIDDEVLRYRRQRRLPRDPAAAELHQVGAASWRIRGELEEQQRPVVRVPGRSSSPAPLCVDRIFAQQRRGGGVMRTPAAGSGESGVEERIVIGVGAALCAQLEWPVKEAPACSRIVSPRMRGVHGGLQIAAGVTVIVARRTRSAAANTSADTQLSVEIVSSHRLLLLESEGARAAERKATVQRGSNLQICDRCFRSNRCQMERGR